MGRGIAPSRQKHGDPPSQRTTRSKRARSEAEDDSKEKEDKETLPQKKSQKTKPTKAEKDPVKEKADALISKYGITPLADLELPDPSSPTPENLLALVYNALLTSTRISHTLAHKSVKCVIEAGYHDIETLRNSTWEERTEVLTKGGYTRYREKTATAFGELADFVTDKYGKPSRVFQLRCNDRSSYRVTRTTA